jgi:hypothetical protein
MQSQPDSPPRRPSPVAIIVAPLAVALIVTLFLWPSSRLEPRDLPVGVAGPPAAAQTLEQKLEAREGAFEVHRYPDEAAARAAIEDRDIYGAFVATPSGTQLLTASAASATVAQTLTRAATEAQGSAPQAKDVVPVSQAGNALPSAVFPLILGGSLIAAFSRLRQPGSFKRAGVVVAGAILAGLAATALIQSWLGVVEGSWAANAGVLTLTLLAIAATVAGLDALFGTIGATTGALLMILIGNPFAGASSGPEMLPEPTGLIGQLMPPGAGINLLRSTGFFDGAAVTGHVVVLAVWAAVGLTMVLRAAALKARRPALVQAPAAA